MSLSLPHFLYGDEELINSIDGINPNESLHQNSMDIDPVRDFNVYAALYLPPPHLPLPHSKHGCSLKI